MNKKNLEAVIGKDLLTIGFNFRINDLNEVLEVQYQDGEWKEYDEITEAKIKLAMRNIGYGNRKAKKPGLRALYEGILVIADRNRYNPIKDYFDALDGYKPKPNGRYLIPTLATYFKNPDGMFETWLFKWLVGTIAKVYEGERNPMLVLVGDQEIGKSYFCRWLCPMLEHYLESGIHNPDDKDNTLSIDANPVSILATRVKLSWDIDLDQIQPKLEDVLEVAAACLRHSHLTPVTEVNYQLSLFTPPIPTSETKYNGPIANDFDPNILIPSQASVLIPTGFISQKPLLRVLALRYAIEKILSKPDIQDFMALALANTIVTTAGNRCHFSASTFARPSC